MTALFKKLFGSGNQAGLPAVVRRQLDFKKRFNPAIPFREAEFVAFDTELSGLDFKKDSIISLGAIRLRGAGILPDQTFYRLIKPAGSLNHASVVVHELTPADLDKGEEPAAVMADFLAFIKDAVLIGHFVHIDLNFVNRSLQKLYGLPLPNPALDTSTLHDWLYENDSRFARHHLGMTSKTDLFSLAQKYGIQGGKAHNAFSDAFITAQLFQRFVSFLPECGIRTVKDLLQIARP